MRALALAVLAACSPDIASGGYQCGPERDCPPDQACNGPDNICVTASTAQPFACDPMGASHEPDDTAAQAFPIAGLACVSAPFVEKNCLMAGDGQNWVKLAVPTNCSAVEVDASIVFPIAFEPLALELWDLSTMTNVPAAVPCGNVGQQNNSAACVKKTITVGGSYGIVIKPAGGSDCAGLCNYNRYQLTVQLATPG